LHFLPGANLLAGYAVNGRSDAVENDDRALGVRQDRLIFLVELFAGLKVEIFAGLAAPVDLPLAVAIGLYLPLELGKDRIRIFNRFVRAVTGCAMSVRVVKHSTIPEMAGSGPSSVPEMIFPLR
jgi:hypothetical protein